MPVRYKNQPTSGLELVSVKTSRPTSPSSHVCLTHDTTEIFLEITLLSEYTTFHGIVNKKEKNYDTTDTKCVV